jgi:hypothetical protein
MPRFLDRFPKDRRISTRHAVKTPLKVRLWKTSTPEHAGESENISEQGMFFATDLRMGIGSVIELVLKMPEAITGEPERNGDAPVTSCGCRRWIPRSGRKASACSLIAIRSRSAETNDPGEFSIRLTEF